MIENGGLSNGAIAGIVIGVLIAVAVAGGVVFVVVTGRTASAGKALKEMPVHFIPRRFRNSPQDKVSLHKETDNPNYTAFGNANVENPYDSYT